MALTKQENKELYKSLFNIAVPIALQSLIGTSLNLVDNLMIGQLGETELAAVGIAFQVYFVQWMLLYGFAGGSAAFMAQFWGVKDIKNIRKVIGFSLIFSLMTGLFFFTAAFFFPQSVISIFTQDQKVIYFGGQFISIISITFITTSISIPFVTALRTTEQAHLPLKISSCAFIINTFLNFTLIFGKFGFPSMGVIGSATATLIARSVELLLLIFVVVVRKNIVWGTIKDFFSFDFEFCKRVLKNAIPTTINETMWGLGMATYAVAYGRMGTTEFAAFQASNTIHSIFILAIFSIGDAILVLVGKEIGKNHFELAYEKAKKLLKLGVFTGMAAGFVLILVSPLVIQLFNFSQNGRHYISVILLIYGFAMWIKLFNGINIVGTFRGGGDTKFAMILEVACVWLVGVPLVFAGTLVLKLPIYWVVLLAHTEEFIKAIICFARFKSKKWINNLIHGI